MIAYASAAAGAAAVGGVGFGTTPAFAAVTWRYPFARRWPVSSDFGPRPSPGDGGSTNHQGIDIAASQNTQIFAVAAGTVIFAGTSGGYGNLTQIRHSDGYTSYYGHQSLIEIANGATVAAGQAIGRVGSTGNSTGSHLHLGILLNGNFIDPAPLILNAPLPSTPTPPEDEGLDDDMFKVINTDNGIWVVGVSGKRTQIATPYHVELLKRLQKQGDLLLAELDICRNYLAQIA